MNRQRRNILYKVLDDLARLRDPVMNVQEALTILQNSAGKVNQCYEEEDAALDRRPENLQWSTTNDNMNDNLSDLSDVGCDLDLQIANCQEMTIFNYDLIESDIIRIVNTINKVIDRR